MTLPSGLAELFRLAFDSRMSDAWSALPGRIHKYDAATQRAEVELGVTRPIEDEESELQAETLPILPDVPVCFPRSTGFSITFPLTKGDPLLVIFSTLDPSEFLATGIPGNTGQIRTHSLGFGFAIPCVIPDLSPVPEAAQQALIIKGEEVRLGENVLLPTLVDAVATATRVLEGLNSIRTAYNAHSHSGAGAPTATQITPFNNIASPSVNVEKPT